MQRGIYALNAIRRDIRELGECLHDGRHTAGHSAHTTHSAAHHTAAVHARRSNLSRHLADQSDHVGGRGNSVPHGPRVVAQKEGA